MGTTDYNLRPIGWVESPLVDLSGAPAQGDEGTPDSWLVIDPQVRPALSALQAGTAIIVLTWLDGADRSILKVHPRGDPRLRRGLRCFPSRNQDEVAVVVEWDLPPYAVARLAEHSSTRGRSAPASMKGTVVNDDELTADVKEELLGEPKVDSVEIAVYVSDGTVTLRGTVGSPRQKAEAKGAARRVHGVKNLIDELEVRVLPGHKRDDAELRGAVLQALALDSQVPQTVDAQVENGWVTLTGTAAWQFERDEAEFVTSNVLGVAGLQDQIELTGPPADVGKVQDCIRSGMRRNATVHADQIHISSSGDTVTLTGVVDSWSEHDAAMTAAWGAPGVRRVIDEILVTY